MLRRGAKGNPGPRGGRPEKPSYDHCFAGPAAIFQSCKKSGLSASWTRAAATLITTVVHGGQAGLEMMNDNVNFGWGLSSCMCLVNGGERYICYLYGASLRRKEHCRMLAGFAWETVEPPHNGRWICRAGAGALLGSF